MGGVVLRQLASGSDSLPIVGRVDGGRVPLIPRAGHVAPIDAARPEPLSRAARHGVISGEDVTGQPMRCGWQLRRWTSSSAGFAPPGRTSSAAGWTTKRGSGSTRRGTGDTRRYARSAVTARPDLQARVNGSSGDKALYEAFHVYRLFTELYEQHVGRIVDCPEVLDFGCAGQDHPLLSQEPAAGTVGRRRPVCCSHRGLPSDQSLVSIRPLPAAAATRLSRPDLRPDLRILGVFPSLRRCPTEVVGRASESAAPGRSAVATTWHRGYIEENAELRTRADDMHEPSTWQLLRLITFTDTHRWLEAYDEGRSAIRRTTPTSIRGRTSTGCPSTGEAGSRVTMRSTAGPSTSRSWTSSTIGSAAGRTSSSR